MNEDVFVNFKKSCFVSLVLTLLTLLLCFFNSSMREELLAGVLVLFCCFIIATFTGFYASGFVKNNFLGLIIAPILSTLLIYFFDFLCFDYIFFNDKGANSSIKNIATVGVLISILAYLFGNYKKNQNSFKQLKISYPLLNSLLFSGVLIVIYSVIFVLVFDGDYLGILEFMYDILAINFLVITILALLIFKYIYENFESRMWFIIAFYFLVLLVFVFFCFYKYNGFDGAMNVENFLTFLLARVPFVFMIMLSVQISFMIEISKRQQEQLTQQSLESQLNYQQLKNQISPHFLFNNINVLTSLIEENPKKAVLFSENLSNIYRYFLDQEKQDVVLVKDEIEFAKSYLELLKDRFEVGLNFSIDIDQKAKEKYIVSTILQQVLENVVKHNTINEDNLINIKISSKENYLIVENNKIPKLITEESSKKGIENIKKRITFFTDEKVIIESTTEVYKIQLPILETIQ